MIHIRLLGVLLVLLVNSLIVAPVSGNTKKNAELLSYRELTQLYDQPTPSIALQGKLKKLLNTPFVSNAYAPRRPLRLANSKELGEHLRVALWNIERGLEFEAIVAAFTNTRRFASLLSKKKFPAGSEAREKILEEANALQKADVIILNEVDWGMKRTGYRKVAEELAKRLRMNYAFGVQFLELTPINLSREKPTDDKEANEMLDHIRVNPSRYKGMHGLAILSRFKLENVRLVPFKHKPYDWYKEELKGPSELEKGKRKVGEIVFMEKSLQQVRRGGRTTLYADISDQRFPSARVTIVATHLENRSKPKGRVKQMNEVLKSIWGVDNEVIMAGDMNTSGRDLRPTSLNRALAQRYGNPEFWAKKSLKYAVGFGFFQDLLLKGANAHRIQGDPTVRNVRLVAPNPARKFFDALEEFKFSDGGVFDFRGTKSHTSGGHAGTLGNSNERADKGFVTTYQIASPKGKIGRYKLDWFFVKPSQLTKPNDISGSHRFAPVFGRTLLHLNNALEHGLSDHRPLIIDLPLKEPRVTVVP